MNSLLDPQGELSGARVAGSRVLVRSDLNVPMDGDQITDDGRLRASLPTLRLLMDAGARVVVAAHLGRPGGEPHPDLSLAPIAIRLGELLGTPVGFVAASSGPKAEAAVQALADGGVLLLENVRFDPRETSKDDAERTRLAEDYAALCDVFVSDGFGVVHRRQASVFEIATLRPSYAGLLVAAEMQVLARLTDEPKRPYAVVLGGSKVSDKLAVIAHLLDRVDRMLVGGGMAFTFLAAQGHPTGASLLEPDQIETVRGLLADADRRGIAIVLPSDIVVAKRFAPDAESTVVAASAIPDGAIGLDIGPAAQAEFAKALADAQTVFWNGPMGVFEFPAFASGTRAVAQALVDSAAFTVVGGGDSAAAVRTLGFDEGAFGHISTGGGASLEFLEGRVLPGIAVLDHTPREAGAR
ncbi:MAG: phosphoglycerate kinase [Actinomycetia bacterium]|nr:phosphoglycerate kinase [Actinomycetes bacterium]